jgi:hypothetical protein
MLKKVAARVTRAVWQLLPATAIHCPGGVEDTALDVAFYALTQEKPCMVAADDFHDFMHFFVQRVWHGNHTPGSQWIRQALLSACQQDFKPLIQQLYDISDPNKAKEASDANQEKIKALNEGDAFAKGDSNVYGGSAGLLGAVEIVLQGSNPEGSVSYSIDTLAYFLASAQTLLSPQSCMPPVGPKLTETIRQVLQKIDEAQLTTAGVPQFTDAKVSTRSDLHLPHTLTPLPEISILTLPAFPGATAEATAQESREQAWRPQSLSGNRVP